MDKNCAAVLLVVVVVAMLASLGVRAAPVRHHKEEVEVRNQDAVEAAGRSASLGHRRVRRQNGEVVESIFQIPISTLQAVSKAFATGIQTFQRGRETLFQATSGGGSRPGGSGGLNAVYNYQQGSGGQNAAYNYQQSNGLSSLSYQQSGKPTAAYSPYKPAYNPYKPLSSYSQAQAQAQAFAVLNRPGYVLYNYNRPRAAGATRAGQQSQAAAVAGVAPQSDGSSYRI